MASMQENNTKRRGRRAGSTSFQKIRLSDLVNNLGPNATVVVGKKWLETIGFEVVEAGTMEIEEAKVIEIEEAKVIEIAEAKAIEVQAVDTVEEPQEKIQFQIS